MSTLSTNDLSVRIGKKVLLHPTSLSFKNGCLAAVVGPNGAGKTTFVKALLGLTTHTGDVLLNDAPVAGLTPKDRAKTLAYLPQGQHHAWPLPVEQVVALGRYPHGGNNRSDEVVDQTIDRLGLNELRTQSVLTLSGGEQMRVAMARALAVEADFLMADEPLASLDPHHQFAMMDTLAMEAKAGHGVVVVIHDLRLAALYADRVIVLDAGQVVADGTPQEVFSEQTITNVFHVRTQAETLERKDGSAVSVALPIPSLAA